MIGQYDVALIGPTRAPRLLFVGPNLSAARERLDVDRDLFLRWIALHETTHAVQFAGVGWLRGHLGEIASELFEKAAIEVKPGELLSKLVRLNPRELVRSVAAGELARLLWTEPQRRLVDRLMAAMTVVEGYAEHVMDAVGEQLDPGYAELRAAPGPRPRAPRAARLAGLEAARPRHEDGPVQARQGLLRRGRARGRASARSTSSGASRSACRASTSSTPRATGSSAPGPRTGSAASRSFASHAEIRARSGRCNGFDISVFTNVCSVLCSEQD